MLNHSESYSLLDSGEGRKLESVGPYLLDRPASGAIWKRSQPSSLWQSADAFFERTSSQKGVWKFRGQKRLPDRWLVKVDAINVWVKLTDFGHIGIFPEHHRSYKWLSTIEERKAVGKQTRVLNLFAYTGVLSLVMARKGAQVVHVDGSKSAVEWAKENQKNDPGLANKVRWIVDDVSKFVKRERRRGSKYHGIILDPPSFGRGPKSEVWKIEDDLPLLLEDLRALLEDDFCFIQLSSHSQYHSPVSLKNMLCSYFDESAGSLDAFEMTEEEESNQRLLPSGACAILLSK